MDVDLTDNTDPQNALALLQGADWSAFVPERELERLRGWLLALEREHGVTEAHRFATARLREHGAKLTHPHIGWDSEFNDYALSPCGRHLATGRWGGDDGPLQIWEMATGRGVNKIDMDEMGVGWSGHRDTIQWSADGTLLAVVNNTNSVGLWDPFGEPTDPIGNADVTDGLDCAPDFALAPDGRRAYISTYSPQKVMGCIAPLTQGPLWYVGGFETDSSPLVKTFPEEIPDEFRRRLGKDTWSFRRVRWSRDGTRLLGFNGAWACSVDVPGGRMRWLARTGGDFVEWSPDDRRFGAIASDTPDAEVGRLTVFDAGTGRAMCAPVEQLTGTLHWGMRGTAARLAVVTRDGRGVDLYDEDGQHEYHLDIGTTERIGVSYWDGPERPWAWSPSGAHGACLTSDDRIEVWSLADDPALVRSIDVPEGTAAVLWGAEGVLAAIGEFSLRFVRALTGDVVGDFVVGMEDEEGLGPVGAEDELHGDHTADTFPLDETTWCALASPPEGPGADLVIAPEERRADLDNVLAWVVDRRFAWPVRWSDLNLVEDADAAEAELSAAVD
ncbi:WD40 repeat domain-containing protein [Actinomadura oligospora]|uniref:WD40 repeat domain-containing protein n=1 Tax=Actinomadura oligospora TaxID=111804 RepID=UPI00047EA46F|nr:WD40 repeat domain-containing protein [Actinomadura oligospora]